jgi:hypothetical protein
MQPIIEFLPWVVGAGALLTLAGVGLGAAAMLCGASGGGVADAPRALGIERRVGRLEARLRRHQRNRRRPPLRRDYEADAARWTEPISSGSVPRARRSALGSTDHGAISA